MKKYIVCLFLSVLCVWNVYSQNEKQIVLTESEYQSIIQRLNALEEKQKSVDAVSGATKKVDAVSSATPKSDAPKRDGDAGKEIEHKRPRWIHNHLTIGGYGEITAKRGFYSNKYLRYVTPENYKNQQFGEFDLPHMVIYLGYDFGRGWSMGTEIEFEHGGIEAATELEEHEGGSEVEVEVERGGEVALEQFWIQKKFNNYAIIRAGMQVVPIGALNAHHEPNKFFNVFRPEGEYTILPSTWHEVALTFMGQTKFGLRYQAMFLPGLDSDRFSRKNWIGSGAGSPYKFKLATVYAGALRLDYEGVKGLRLSLSGYAGNSFRNSMMRAASEQTAYKDVKGTVTIGSFDFLFDDYNIIIRGNATYGHLTDSKEIRKYNSISEVSNKTAVASDAIAAGIEAGYDFFSLNERLRSKNQKFYVFARYEYYDSFFRYDDQKSNKNLWCGRQKISAGINYYPIKEVGIKAEYTHGIINKGANGIKYNDEPAIAIGIVFAGMFKL